MSLQTYFTYIVSTDSICLACKEHFSRADSSTSNCRRHLRKKHPKLWEKLTAAEKAADENRKRKAEGDLEGQASMKRYFAQAPAVSPEADEPSSSASVTSPPSSKQETLAQSYGKWAEGGIYKVPADEALVKLIAGANLPLSLVDHPCFKQFCHALAPGYKVPCRDTLMRKLDDACEAYEKKIREELDQAVFVSFTSDVVTTKNLKHSLVSLTGHFFTSEGVLQHRYLSVMPIKGDHDGETISAELKKSLCYYDVESRKVHLLVRDAASSMIRTARLLGMDSADCFAHKLHNAVKDGLKVLKSFDTTITKVKKVVKKVRKSGVELRKLKALQEENNLPQYALIQGVEMRWNSVYDMIKLFLENRVAVEGLFATDDPRDPKYPTISDAEWDNLELVLEVLKPMYDAIVQTQSRRTTISAVLPIYLGLTQMTIKKTRAASMQKAMIDGLKSRMTDWRQQPWYYVATALDPRFKLTKFTPADQDFIKNRVEQLAIQRSRELADRSSPAADELDAEPATGDMLLDFLNSLDPIEAPPTAPMAPTVRNSRAKAQVEVAEFYAENVCAQHPSDYWHRPDISARFPVLKLLALQYHCAPATSMESEQWFSSGTAILSHLRQSMTTTTFQKLLFLYRNINSYL